MNSTSDYIVVILTIVCMMIIRKMLIRATVVSRGLNVWPSRLCGLLFVMVAVRMGHDSTNAPIELNEW